MGWDIGGGAGAAQAVMLHGLEDYNDTATASAPIALTLANQWYTLTNNGLGPNSQTDLRLPGRKQSWNPATSQFEFDDNAIGDGVLLRTDVTVTTGVNNQGIELGLRLAANSGTPFVLSMGRQEFKTAGAYQIVLPYWFYIGSALTRDNGAEIVARCDGVGSTVVVAGWALRTEPRVITV